MGVYTLAAMGRGRRLGALGGGGVTAVIWCLSVCTAFGQGQVSDYEDYRRH